jgi:hypothetical protein
MPQPPQWTGSKFVSAHVPLQFVRPPGQGKHTPYKQTGLAPEQVFPQAPQLRGSDCR